MVYFRNPFAVDIKPREPVRLILDTINRDAQIAAAVIGASDITSTGVGTRAADVTGENARFGIVGQKFAEAL